VNDLRYEHPRENLPARDEVGPMDATAIPQGKTNLHRSRVSHLKTFRKRVYEKTEGYDESILYAEDKDLTYKMEEVGSVLRHANPALSYTILVVI
jgi:hypothetical protein